MSIGVGGADADPINNGKARSAPTTIKAATITYDRGLLQRNLEFEGEALVILGFSLRTNSEDVSCEETRVLMPEIYGRT